MNWTNHLTLDHNSGITTISSTTASSSNLRLQPAGITGGALAHAAALAAQIKDVMAKVFVTRKRARDTQVAPFVVLLGNVVVARETRVNLLAGRPKAYCAACSLARRNDEHLCSALLDEGVNVPRLVRVNERLTVGGFVGIGGVDC